MYSLPLHENSKNMSIFIIVSDKWVVRGISICISAVGEITCHQTWRRTMCYLRCITHYPNGLHPHYHVLEDMAM